MLFNSYIFMLAFFPVFLIVFFAVRKASYDDPKMRELCKALVAAFSLLFYAPFGWRNLLALVMSIVVNGVLAWILVRHTEKVVLRKEEGLKGADESAFVNGTAALTPGRILLGAAVTVNVIWLLAFKFNGIFFPVAVSFYTFNQISYLVDLYRGEIPVSGETAGNGNGFDLLGYLSYILFFPKLLQGPLMRYSEFDEEFEKALDACVDYEVLLRSLYLFSMGLFKKVILADTFGKAVNWGFDNIPTLGSLEAVLVAAFYSFQLYFDFSGYCDMAAGVCKMMGFELPLNFNSPYKAENIIDFWKRWHITLTKFFTKYIYIPLGGNRKGMARMYTNLMIVFLVSGLWHGNGWTFIIWGVLHGALYVVTRMLKDHPLPVPRAIKVIMTFIYVTLAWVFFRAANVRDALLLIGRMFTGGRKPIASALSSCFMLDELWYVIKVTPIMKLSFAWDICLWLFVAFAAAVVFFAPNAIERARRDRIGVKTTLLTGLLLVWSVVSFAGVSTFLYMNF
ncbi:MAG: MBOAT family protein [Butyrivibrio sp.]|nr:MBOAT family protein [Butyrivibrio sp.]